MAGGEPAVMRGFLKIGAGTVARHQLALALAMECQLVVCIARGLGPELIDLQHAAEKAGVRFQIVAGARAFANLVTAADEVIVIADGLFASLQTARAMLELGPAVLVQPIESGALAGFERVDIDHASAGLLRVPGHLAERLAELPLDCDVASALTRIALQAGIAQRDLPSDAGGGFNWLLVRNEDEAHRIEADWIGLQVSRSMAQSAGALLARLGVKAVGPALLHAGNGGNALAIGAFAVALLALGGGWAGFTTAALAACALAWILRRTAGSLLQIERESLGKPAERWSREAAFGWILDAIVVAIVVWSPQTGIWSNYGERLFAPFMLVCTLRLIPKLFDGKWIAWLEDRAVWAVVLAIASASGSLHAGVQWLAAALALLGILLPARGARLTRV